MALLCEPAQQDDALNICRQVQPMPRSGGAGVGRLVSLLPNPQSRHGHARHARYCASAKGRPSLLGLRRRRLKSRLGESHGCQFELLMSWIMTSIIAVLSLSMEILS
jgi:hypothetical protein